MIRRTALITGASAGLGAEFAGQLAQMDMSVVLVARRLELLASLADELSSRYPEISVHTFAADLSDPEAPRQIYEWTQDASIDVDWLVNNAGAGGPDLMDGEPWAAHAAYLNLMMTSMTELCHYFVPQMTEQGFGRVINVSSVAGRIARGGDCHYGPAKAYVVALSEALALTTKDAGVHVTALCPGFTHTDFHAQGELADMKAATPGFIWYNASTVVREGIRAVQRGKRIMISGRLYRWLDPLLQSKLVRPLLQRIAG